MQRFRLPLTPLTITLLAMFAWLASVSAAPFDDVNVPMADVKDEQPTPAADPQPTPAAGGNDILPGTPMLNLGYFPDSAAIHN